MSKPRRVLFLTNSEYGQANVVLAVAHSLMHIATDTEVHIASFEPLRRAVQVTSDDANETASKSAEVRPMSFHEIRGVPYVRLPVVTETYDLRPGLINSARGILAIPEIMLPWEPSDFSDICKEVEHIIDQVQPDLTVVEPLFTPGLTICNHRGMHWIVLAPNSIKDFAVPIQPALAALWKYPLVCSALPFPLPWNKIPHNIALNFVAAYMILTNTRLASTATHLLQQMGRDIQLMTANDLGVLKAPPTGIRILTASSIELDYPFNRLPEYVVPCGPIVRPSKPLVKIDPGLLSWLSRGPAVYVNLGTYLTATPTEAVELARALKELLAEADRVGYEKDNGGLRVLWKLGRKDPSSKDKRPTQLSDQDWSGEWKKVVQVLGPEMDIDRVRITGWFAAEPKSILESGRIVCSVHHGGASSFNECVCAGIPQVLLPPWADCYDFANRVELLGIGVWANKLAKPRWQHKELASALVRVILGNESEAIRIKAAELGKKYPEDAGRKRAAQEILSAVGKD